MRLTRRGSDYNLAVLLLAVLGTVTGYTLFAALALGMVFAAAVSLVLLGLLAGTVEPRAPPEPLRVMKNEKSKLLIAIPGLRGPWASMEVESAKVDGPVEASIEAQDETSLAVMLKPSLAGRFRGLRLKIRTEDALGLFYSSRTVELGDVTIDSLPLSLVAPIRRAYIPPLVVGETPAGSAGRGQEFFGVQTYTEHTESKDILWNRFAKEPDRPLLARVREANNPESVTVQVMHYEIESRWTLLDLQCEALGSLGRALILAGIRADIVAPDGSRHPAGTDEELAEAVMLAAAPEKVELTPGWQTWSDLLVLVGEPSEEDLLRTARRPTVIIGGGRVRLTDRYAVVFTGAEDLLGIVGLVLTR